MGPDSGLVSALTALVVSIGGNALLALRECADSSCDGAAKLAALLVPPTCPAHLPPSCPSCVVPSCPQQNPEVGIDWVLHSAVFAGGLVFGIFAGGLCALGLYLCLQRKTSDVPPPPARLRSSLANLPPAPLRLVDAGSL